MPTLTPPAAPSADNLISDIVSGLGMSFDYQGRTYYMRPPGLLESDQAEYLERLAISTAYAMPDVKALQAMPVSDEYAGMVKAAVADLRKRMVKADKGDKEGYRKRINELGRKNRADELAEDWGRMTRDRYLVMVCLNDADGTQVFDGEESLNKPGARGMMNVARPVLWSVMAVANSVPFGWEPGSGQPLGWQNDSDNGPTPEDQEA